MKGFSAADEIAKQDARMEKNRKHFAEQEERVSRGDILGYWRAEWETRKHVVPISRQAEVAMEAWRQLIEHLKANQLQDVVS